MADNNHPDTGTVEPTSAPTEEKLIGELADLLDDSEPPNHVEDDHESADNPGEEDDPLGLEDDAEDVADTETDDNPDGPDDAELKGGRFAPDSAKVKLDTGETITIKELKVHAENRFREMQRGFTQTTQAFSEERKAFETEKSQLSEYAQSLNQARDYVAWYAENFLPKQPEPFSGAPDDYVGFIEWQKKNAEWQVHAQAYQAFQEQKKLDELKRNGETEAEARKHLAQERNKLLEAIPVLKDPVKGKQVWANIVTGAQQHYQLTEQEVNSVGDHRFLKVLRDALAYRQLKAKAPEVRTEVARKPVNPGKRQANQQVIKGRQDRLERLKRSPTLENGAASLMDFDL